MEMEEEEAILKEKQARNMKILLCTNSPTHSKVDYEEDNTNALMHKS